MCSRATVFYFFILTLLYLSNIYILDLLLQLQEKICSVRHLQIQVDADQILSLRRLKGSPNKELIKGDQDENFDPYLSYAVVPQPDGADSSSLY